MHFMKNKMYTRIREKLQNVLTILCLGNECKARLNSDNCRDIAWRYCIWKIRIWTRGCGSENAINMFWWPLASVSKNKNEVRHCWIQLWQFGKLGRPLVCSWDIELIKE